MPIITDLADEVGKPLILESFTIKATSKTILLTDKAGDLCAVDNINMRTRISSVTLRSESGKAWVFSVNASALCEARPDEVSPTGD